MNRLSVALRQLVGQSPAQSLSPDRNAAENHGPAGLAALVAGLAPLAVIFALGLGWMLAHPQNAVLAAIAKYADRLHAAAVPHPVLAWAAFVVAYALAVSLMLPVALILTFAGGYLLGPLAGSLASMSGATLGAAISYGLASLSPPWLVARWERRFPRLRKFREAVSGHPFRFTLSMRLMPLTPFTVVSMSAGLARISLGWFTAGTLLGVAPECIAYSMIGAGVPAASWLSDGAPTHPIIWIGLAAAAALVVAVPSIVRRALVRSAEIEAALDRQA